MSQCITSVYLMVIVAVDLLALFAGSFASMNKGNSELVAQTLDSNDSFLLFGDANEKKVSWRQAM